jgi:hypothetical protein
MAHTARSLRQPLSRDFAAGAVIALLFVAVPVAAYADYPGVFGESARLKLFAFCGLGMSAAFSLFVGRGKRLIALMPGLAAGLSGAGLYLYVPQALLGAEPARQWGYIAFIVGALLGLPLYWLARKLFGAAHDSVAA